MRFIIVIFYLITSLSSKKSEMQSVPSLPSPYPVSILSCDIVGMHKPPGTGSQVADGIHLVIVYGRLGFV